MATPIVITATSQRNDDLGAARFYLRAIESVARHGRTSPDPREVLAVLRMFARPSRALRSLAGVRS